MDIDSQTRAAAVHEVSHWTVSRHFGASSAPRLQRNADGDVVGRCECFCTFTKLQTTVFAWAGVIGEEVCETRYPSRRPCPFPLLQYPRPWHDWTWFHRDRQLSTVDVKLVTVRHSFRAVGIATRILLKRKMLLCELADLLAQDFLRYEENGWRRLYPGLAELRDRLDAADKLAATEKPTTT